MVDLNKEIEKINTNDIEDVLSLLEKDKYITLNVENTRQVILKKKMNENELNLFIDSGLEALKELKFKPLEFDIIKEHIEIHLQNIDRNERNSFNINSMRKLVDNCEIYGQNYNIIISDLPACIFMMRTPTEIEFNKAKIKISEILNYFKTPDKKKVENVTMTVRGTGRTIDIEASDLNTEAWLGFEL